MRLLRNSWRLAAAFALLAVAAAALFSFLPVRADMTILLPEQQNGDLALLFRSLREGPANRTILIGLASAGKDGALQEPRAVSRAFKQALEKTGRFEWIANGEFRRDLSAVAPFFAHRYQLNPPLDPAQFTADGLRTALKRLLDLLHGIAAPVVGEIMAADPTLRTLAVASQWTAPSARTKQGVWVDREGRHALLVARTGSAGFDLAAQAAAISAVRDAAAGLESRFGKLDVELSGPSVIAVESRRIAEAESQRLGLISVPLVTAMLLLTLRRLAALPVLFLPFGCGFLAASALVGAIFGYLHATTIGFGMTLLGVAVDYPLHLMAHGKEGGAAEAARKIGPRLLIAVSATVLAFLPLLMSSFPGLAQLGVFSVAGLVVAAAVTRWILPHISSPFAETPYRPAAKVPHPIRRGMGLLRVPALLAGIAAVAVLALRAEPLWQQDLAALSPIPPDIRARDAALRRNLTAADPRHVVTVSGKTVEEAMQRSERLLPALAALKDAKELDGFEMAALYVPSAASQHARLAALPSDADLRANLDRAQQGLPFKPGAFEPFLHAVTAARAAPPLTPLGFEDLTLRARLEPLLLQSDGGVKALILLRGLRNPAGLRKSIDESGVTGVNYLDLKQSAEALMDGYRAETLRWVLLGAVLSLALLALSLRSTRAVFAVTMPVLLSVAVTMAILAATSGGLTIFHLVGLLMVGGLSVDYAVFLREDDARGTGLRGVALCFGTDLAGFALLATAAVPVLSQIGSTVAVGCTLSFLFGLAFTAPRAGRPA